MEKKGQENNDSEDSNSSKQNILNNDIFNIQSSLNLKIFEVHKLHLNIKILHN